VTVGGEFHEIDCDQNAWTQVRVFVAVNEPAVVPLTAAVETSIARNGTTYWP